jgi:hypothetical protein
MSWQVCAGLRDVLPGAAGSAGGAVQAVVDLGAVEVEDLAAALEVAGVGAEVSCNRQPAAA